VRALAARAPGRVDLLVRPGKAGLGRAYVDAFTRLLAADAADVVVQMDADGSHDPADIDRLVAALDAPPGAGLAIGSRYVPGGRVADWTWARRALSRGGNAYARAWLRLHVADLTGGFKAWRADVLRALDLEQVTSDGYVFQIETTLRAVATGARVVEVPITFRDRRAGASKMSTRIAREAVTAVPRLARRPRHPVGTPGAGRPGRWA
jgi:dolichol-phosphate mannosyltransferase